MMPRAASRRALLTLAGTAVATLTLAACSTGQPVAAPVGQSSAASSAAAGRPAPGGQSASQDPASVAGLPAGCERAGAQLTSTAAELSAALRSAAPGATIMLAAGMYRGRFKATASGSASAPVTLCGPRGAVLDGGSISSGYVLHLDHASYWRLEGFTVADGQKGVVTDASDHVLIDGLYVHDIGDEGIHLRDFSSYDTVTRNVVRATGLHKNFYGEGIYVGTAHHNWCRYSGCSPDGSDYDTITGNDIAGTTAENVDIKEGTVGGLIAGNHFNGIGMDSASATSWVNVKGNGWRITGNTGVNSVANGFSDHQVYPGWGMDNAFRGNRIAVNGPGYGIFIQSTTLNDLVSCTNTATGAQRGLSNVPCSTD